MTRFNRFAPVALVLSSLAASPAFAALDVTAATTSIADASTGAGTVLAALIGLAATIWALRKIAGLFGR